MSDVAWTLWDGRPLPGSEMLAFDTETRADQDLKREVPDGVLLTAWAGEGPVAVVPVERWPEFINLHISPGVCWVGFNTTFDFDVVRKELHGYFLREMWTELVERNRMVCLMLLEGLVRLATGEIDLGEDKKCIRNLEVVCGAWQVDCAPPDKASPYRKRFAELLDEPDWLAPHVDPGFFQYAAIDCIATYRLGEVLLRRAWQLHDKLDQAKLHPNHRQWGPLTANIQLKGAIALADISRRGFHVDVEQAWRTEANLRHEYQEHVTWLEMNYPGLIQTVSPPEGKPANGKKPKKVDRRQLLLFPVPPSPEGPAKPKPPKKKKRAGRRQLTANDAVKMSTKRLRVILEDLAADLRIEAPRSKGKQRLVSLSADDWQEHASQGNEFLRRWLRTAELVKQFSFMSLFRKVSPDDPVVRSRYLPLVRTGRVSASSPNVMQIPKDEAVRELFTARPGTLLYVCDFAAIELRTLAYCCEKWQGSSVLADVIRSGKDPHCYTTAIFLGENYNHVAAQVALEKGLPKGSPKPYTDKRQKGKALAFGRPGGLGAHSLRAYARLNYNVHLSEAEAKELARRISDDVYPELNDRNGWLSTDVAALLAENLELPYDDVFLALVTKDNNLQRLGICLERVLRGCAVKADGTPYNERYVQELWALGRYLSALSLTQSARLASYFATYAPSDALADCLFSRRALTPTGRLRAGVQYTQKCNGPFQGLASDGAKLALWRLWRKGFKVVAFIHDEVVVEVADDSTAKAQGEAIDAILIEAMSEVMEGFPVAVEGKLSPVWKK